MNQRLLVITCHRLDETGGGQNASKGFIRCFADLFDDCSLIYPEFPGDTTPFIPGKYKLFPCHDGRPRLLKGLDMYRGVVGGLYGCVCRHLQEHRYDIVVIDHSAAATSLVKTIKQTGAKLITIHHNVERDYLRDNGRERPITYRLPYNYFARKAERDCLRFSDLNLTISERDAVEFRSWYKDCDIHAHYWGCFEYRPIANKSFSSKQKGCTFVITGSLCFLQSLQPILQFISHYWPIVRKECPQAQLIIAGRNPHQLLKDACAAQADISLIPNPEDMSVILQQADYYVCPINAGSGLKLRIMDGLRQGLPILCHEISMAGYECMADCGCLFGYHDEVSFTTALHELLTSAMSPDTVYRTFQAHFSAEAGADRLRTILHLENIIRETI